MGKNAAITVVANALFAQSYSDHDIISFLESFMTKRFYALFTKQAIMIILMESQFGGKHDSCSSI